MHHTMYTLQHIITQDKVHLSLIFLLIVPVQMDEAGVIDPCGFFSPQGFVEHNIWEQK